MAGSILDALWGLVMPQEAEAKIVPAGAEERKMLGGVKATNARQRGQYLPDMQQRIVKAAEASPATVTLLASPGLMQSSPADPLAIPATAAYDPQRSEVLYDPGLPGRDQPNTLAHELIHFLNAQQAHPQGVAVQHALIKKLLGTNTYAPTLDLQGYQPGAFSPVEHSILNEWLGGPRDWPR